MNENDLVRKNEFTALLRILSSNEFDVEYKISDILDRALVKTPGKTVEETLFTFNSLRVTYGVSYEADGTLVTSYRLYQNDKELIKTDRQYPQDVIDFDEETLVFLLSSNLFDNLYMCFVGEIIVNCVKDLSDYYIAKYEGSELTDILIKGQEKMTDHLHYMINHDMIKPDFKSHDMILKVDLGREVTVSVSIYDVGTWPYRYHFSYSLSIDNKKYGYGKAQFDCTNDKLMDADTIREINNMAYLSMLGSWWCICCENRVSN